MKHKTKKDRRGEKTGAKSIDPQCRNNGVCPACYSNRNYKNIKRLGAIKYEENADIIGSSKQK